MGGRRSEYRACMMQRTHGTARHARARAHAHVRSLVHASDTRLLLTTKTQLLAACEAQHASVGGNPSTMHLLAVSTSPIAPVGGRHTPNRTCWRQSTPKLHLFKLAVHACSAASRSGDMVTAYPCTPPPWLRWQGENGVQSFDLNGVGSISAIPPTQIICFVDHFNKLE